VSEQIAVFDPSDPSRAAQSPRVARWSLWLYRGVRWLLAAVFIAAGLSKLVKPAVFAKAIGDFGIVYPPLLMATAVSLSLLEVAAGVGLALNIRGSLAAISGLLLLFMAVLAYGLWLGLDIDCGCLAIEVPLGWGRDLAAAFWRDVVLLGLCGFLYARSYFR
jgi:uncharacterized membrane protein YphA (DoxX/SURF4 family)